MDNGWFRGPFQQYFSRNGTIEGWTWKTLCNEAPFRFGNVLASSRIRTRDSVIRSRNFQGNQTLTCDILEAHFSSYFFHIFFCRAWSLYLTARRRIVLAPPPQALSIFHKSPSWTSSSLYYTCTTSKIVAIQVMIFTQFTCGKYGKSDLHADFVCTFIFPYWNPYIWKHQH